MPRESEAAASSVMGMMLAAALFVAVVGVVLYVGNEGGENQQHRLDSQFYQHRAQALSATLLDSPGFSTLEGDWSSSSANAEAVSRLGLRDADGRHLNFTKFENLRLAPLAADPNDGYVNYPEALESLGLDEMGMDFHIRAYPSLRSVREILEEGRRDINLKVAYVGDISPSNGGGGGGGASDPPAGLSVSGVSCTRSPYDAKVLRLQATVHNGGLATTMFHVVFDADFGTGAGARREGVSLVAPPGSAPTVAVDFATAAARTCADVDSVDVEVSDTSTNLLWEWTVEPVPLAAPDATSPQAQALWLVRDQDELFVTLGSAAYLDHDGAGNNDLLDVRVRDAAGALVHQQLNVKSKDLDSIVVPASALTAVGNYTVFLRHVAKDITVTHPVVVVDPADLPAVFGPATGGGTGETTGDLSEWSESAIIEVQILEKLIWNFCPYYFDDGGTTPVAGITHDERCPFRPTARLPDQDGDVFPHAAKVLVKDMRPRLVFPSGHAQAGQADVNTTQLLVIGSNVNHQGLVHIKEEVKVWVAGGGTLIVFGSDDTNTQWMRSLYSIGIDASNNGIAQVNDASHPVLHKPDELDYGRYQNTVDGATIVWDFNDESEYNKFANVIGDDEGMSSVLGVSDAGSFGKGNILLTSYFPYDIFRTGPSADTTMEGTRLVNNLLMVGYRTLYLDYGPQIPDGVKVIPATSTAEILHPQLGLVTLSIVVYAFPG